MRSKYIARSLTATCLSVGMLLVPARVLASTDDLDDLMQMSLQDLTQIQVTSVSKRAEKANEVAAAISVITAEDIRRSGANTVPEVLRGIPGLQVSRINAGWWAISARGNANQFGNKLLVLLDGRSLYNPMFSGVVWEEQGTPLEDIERIEVIRGPGSTLWGSNAVNGVINIITKNSKDTQGDMIAAGIGNFESTNAYGRHGGKIGDDATYRTYANHFVQDNSESASGAAAFDGWDMTRAGLRVDGKLDNEANYTVSSDVYKGSRDIPFTRVPDISIDRVKVALDEHQMYGGDVITKYSRKLADDSNVDLQVYYDFVGRDGDEFGQKIQTLDFDAQHTFDINKRNQFIWGGGYRVVYAEMDPSLLIRYPYGNTELTQLVSAFAQDKIELVPNKLFLTLGSKFEYNTYTNFEVQPNARLAWLPTPNQTVWTAVTKAVRTPSIDERNMSQIVGATPAGYVQIQANPNIQSEELIAYEVGYRNQPLTNVSFDATAFINQYHNLRTIEPGGTPGGDVVISLIPENLGERTTTGFELAANWDVEKNWSLSGTYSYLNMDFKHESGSLDTIAASEDGKSPTNMYSIKSHYIFNSEWEMDNSAYYYGAITGSSGDPNNVKAFTRMDAKLTYKPMEGVETALIGQNLLYAQHQEFGSSIYSQPYEIPRSVYAKITLRF